MSSSTHAEIGSLHESADAIRRRITSLVETLTTRDDAELMAILHETERSLLSAVRHLSRAVRLTR